MKKSGRRRFLGPGERFFKRLLICFEILRVTFTTTSYTFPQMYFELEMRGAEKRQILSVQRAVSQSPPFNLLAPISSSFLNFNLWRNEYVFPDI